MSNFNRFCLLITVLAGIGLASGCDTDYDATVDVEDEADEQLLEDEEDVGFEAPNPAFDTTDPAYTSIYDNEDSQVADDAIEYIEREQTVYFEPDLALLSDEAKVKLQQFAEAIEDQPLDDMEISITSWAASESGEAYDAQLSELRAQVVRDFLQQQGVHVANWDINTMVDAELDEDEVDATEGIGMEEANRVEVSLVPFGETLEELG